MTDAEATSIAESHMLPRVLTEEMALSDSSLGKKWAAGETEQVAKILTKAFDNFRSGTYDIHLSNFLRVNSEMEESNSKLLDAKMTLNSLKSKMNGLLENVRQQGNTTTETTDFEEASALEER